MTKYFLAFLISTASFSQAGTISYQLANRFSKTTRVVGYSSIALACCLDSKRTKKLPQMVAIVEASVWLSRYLIHKLLTPQMPKD